MIETLTPARPFNTSHRGDCLHDLIARIATGDRRAFRVLYAFLAMRVWRDAVRTLPHPVDARAVMRSTFVEVWHLAGHHLDDDGSDIDAWIAAITARRVHDRLRACDTQGLLGADYDHHTRHEVVALLGAGHAMIRTGPGIFTRVADLRPRALTADHRPRNGRHARASRATGPPGRLVPARRAARNRLRARTVGTVPDRGHRRPGVGWKCRSRPRWCDSPPPVDASTRSRPT